MVEFVQILIQIKSLDALENSMLIKKLKIALLVNLLAKLVKNYISKKHITMQSKIYFCLSL